MLAPGGLKSRLILVSPPRNLSFPGVWIEGVFVVVPRRVERLFVRTQRAICSSPLGVLLFAFSVFYFRVFSCAVDSVGVNCARKKRRLRIELCWNVPEPSTIRVGAMLMAGAKVSFRRLIYHSSSPDEKIGGVLSGR